jgi:hypothetical protein
MPTGQHTALPVFHHLSSLAVACAALCAMNSLQRHGLCSYIWECLAPQAREATAAAGAALGLRAVTRVVGAARPARGPTARLVARRRRCCVVPAHVANALAPPKDLAARPARWTEGPSRRRSSQRGR